jgi:MFS family permease
MKRENLFFATVVLFWFAQYIYMPFMNPYMQSIGISATIIGMIGGVYGVMQMVLRVPLSLGVSMAMSHKLIICAGLIAVAPSCALPLFSHSWVAFFITRTLAGLSSTTWISYTAYQLEGAGAAANQRMGLIMACNTGGICVSQLIGTAVYDHIGINGLFVIGGAAAMLGLVFMLITPFRPSARPRYEKGKYDWSLFTGALRNKNLWICSGLMSAAWWVMFSTNYGFTGVFARDALGAHSLHLGLIAFICQVASVTVSLVFGRLKGRRLPERGLLIIAFACFGAYCVLSGYCTDANALVLLQILGGASVAVPNVILFSNAGRELSAAQQVLAMGIFQSVYSIGMTFGPIVSGLILDAPGGSYKLMFNALGCVAIVGAIGSLLWYKNPPKTDLA